VSSVWHFPSICLTERVLFSPPAPIIKLQLVLIIPLKQLSAELTKQPAVALTIPVEQTTAALTQVGPQTIGDFIKEA
tara:strand:- start:70 stop:300 length:231 start_codon:yes stop_codon:yes gene_type:complete